MFDHIEAIRDQFPALALAGAHGPRIYLDNPAGTQVPSHVIGRTTECMIKTNANHDGFFETSKAADQVVADGHAAMADLLGANSGDEIIFGQNMTSLTFHISRSLGRLFSPGDEIVLTRMDHDANVAPWKMLADDLGLTVKWLDFNPDTFEFDVDALDDLLGPRTRLVAFGYASNLTGTINDVKAITRKAKAAGALTFIDAVQYAPHGLIDVRDVGCDMLACSPYKFFGPHQGVLWGRADLLAELTAYKVRPASNQAPGKFETGTLSHEGIAGTLGAVEYLEWYAVLAGATVATRRDAIWAAFDAMKGYEQTLTLQLIEGLEAIPGTTIQGITDRARMDWRVPTVSFTHGSRTPDEIARHLAANDIFVWSGNNYALEVTTRLGLEETGGVVRIGMAHYNTPAEIERTLAVLRDFL